MAILVDERTEVIVQGITSATGRAFSERLIAGGTPVVAGTSRGKAGERVAGIPVFASVADARRAAGGNTCLSVLGPLAVREGVLEAFAAGIELMIVYAENVPLHDALLMVEAARRHGARLLGPNSAGVLSPGRASVSDINPDWVPPGPVGIVSKSGTLTYEIAGALAEAGLGTSTIACLGGDRVIGTTYADLLPLFEADPQTAVVVLVGEPGGRLEQQALPLAAAMTKPVVAYFAGRHGPAGKRLGHAGAISGADDSTASAKAAEYAQAGLAVADLLTDVVGLVRRALNRRPGASAAGTGGAARNTRSSRPR